MDTLSPGRFLSWTLGPYRLSSSPRKLHPPDSWSAQILCAHRLFVPMDISSPQILRPMDSLFPQTLCLNGQFIQTDYSLPHGIFVFTDTVSRQKLCLPDSLSPGIFVTFSPNISFPGLLVTWTLCPLDSVSPVLFVDNPPLQTLGPHFF